MLRHRDVWVSDRAGVLFACYFAAIGGFVNASGFILLGAYTSHVTGAVALFAIDVARLDGHGAYAAFAIISGFVFGAFTASMIVTHASVGVRPQRYAAALGLETALLVVAIADQLRSASHISVWPAVLATAMGLQNGVVTRLSGNAVRTTHLTGLLTDIGLEIADWIYARVKHVKRATTPDSRFALFVWIALSFTAGAFGGALATSAVQSLSLLVPTAALASLALWFSRAPRLKA